MATIPRGISPSDVDRTRVLRGALRSGRIRGVGARRRRVLRRTSHPYLANFAVGPAQPAVVAAPRSPASAIGHASALSIMKIRSDVLKVG